MSPTGANTAGDPGGTGDSSGAPSAIDRLLDVGLYAPLWLLSSRGDIVPDLAAKGRKQAAFSRSLGRAALKAVAANGRTGAKKPVATTAPSRASSASASAAASEIADYGSLTAREIVAMIPTSTPQQREWILATEKAGKGRVTVLKALQRD